MECCQADYSTQFDSTVARGELDDYRSGQIKKNSRPLLKILTQLPVRGLSLLDIGGGIGVNSYELHKRGLGRSTQIELSSAYADFFESEIRRLGLEGECLRGDFVKIHTQVPDADLVCLDKAICCYGEYADLVKLSCRKARRWYAFVIPKSVWWVRLVSDLGNGWRKLTGNGFRTYVHPFSGIDGILASERFRNTYMKGHREWLTCLYERS